MILDNVLDEEVIYTEDSMVDMFVEGFLYALEMQENGQKASSMEELSETLSEAANTAISEISAELANKAAQKAQALYIKHNAIKDKIDKRIKNNTGNYDKKYHDYEQFGNRDEQRDHSKRNMHKDMSLKYGVQATRINAAISRKNDRLAKNKK